jgi:hypothetical protein
MAITRKPKAPSAPDEATVQELISKGGSVPAAAAAQERAHSLPVSCCAFRQTCGSD